MMARSIWTGAIGFGLVHVPVRLYTATEDKTVRFHQLDEDTGKRVHNQRVTSSGKEVPYENIVRGYETSKGKYVVLTDDELAAAEPEKTKTIDIEGFVDLHEIDPIFFTKTYYVFPDERAEATKPFQLLRRALEDSERIAIGRFVMREHEYLVAIRPYGPVLALETMFFPDEIRDPKKVADPPKSAKVNERERDMAARLIDSMTMEWQPSRFHDTHRERVLDIIHRKSKGQEIVAEEAEAEEGKVIDLMEALRKSIEGKGSRARRASKRAPAKKHGAKKAAAKKTSKRTTKKTAAKRRKAS
jgi:DNA end-binding protein Ku